MFTHTCLFCIYVSINFVDCWLSTVCTKNIQCILQVSVREKELLTIMSKEKLWSYWQGMVTAIIKRALGPSRMKVVPPVRLPSQLGEGKTRPKTSRARPLTARRNKVLTSDKNNPQLGPVSSFHFIKVRLLQYCMYSTCL